MYKDIEMILENGEKVLMPFAANAATPIRLKQLFGKDFWKAIGDLQIDESTIYENMDIISELAYTMYCQGGGDDVSKANFDTYVRWLESLDGMAIMTNAAAIVSLYVSTNKTVAVAKKEGALQPGA